ncbi:MAG: Chaperone SurA [Myxococcota bacterium]|nr:Chaperone SurA [Myxococcota bacterium]
MRPMKRSGAPRAAGLVLVLALLAASGAALARIVEQIIASVNDEIITMTDVRQRATLIAPRLGIASLDNLSKDKLYVLYADILDELIYEKLMKAEAKKQKLEAADDDIDGMIQETAKQNNITLDQLKDALEAGGVSMESYRDTLRSQIERERLIGMKVRSRIKIPDSRLQAYYELQMRKMKLEEEVQGRHIMLRIGTDMDDAAREAVKKKAEDLLTAVRKGADFGKLAREHSEDPSAAGGGDLGWHGKGYFFEEMEKALFSLKENEATLIRSPSGWHVVQVTGRRLKGAAPFDQVKERIRERLMQEEIMTETKKYLDGLREESHVVVKVDYRKMAGLGEPLKAPDSSANAGGEIPPPVPRPDGEPSDTADSPGGFPEAPRLKLNFGSGAPAGESPSGGGLRAPKLLENAPVTASSTSRP